MGVKEGKTQKLEDDNRLIGGNSGILLFRQGFTIKEDKLRAYLQIHTTHNYGELLNFGVNY